MTDVGHTDREEIESEVVSLNEMFKVYCGLDPISSAANIELLPLSQIDKWLHEAKILDMRKVTSTDTGLCFFKFRKRAINYEEFLECIRDLADTKKFKFDDVIGKLRTCALPVDAQNKKKK